MSVGVSVGFGACGMVDLGDSSAMDGHLYRSALYTAVAVVAPTVALRYIDDNT